MSVWTQIFSLPNTTVNNLLIQTMTNNISYNSTKFYLSPQKSDSSWTKQRNMGFTSESTAELQSDPGQLDTSAPPHPYL